MITRVSVYTPQQPALRNARMGAALVTRSSQRRAIFAQKRTPGD
jgi:hypothetical protein